MIAHGHENAQFRRALASLLRLYTFGGFALALAPWMAISQPAGAQGATIRVGYFPNVTHVQALVARNFERHGRSWFAERLGTGVKIEWQAHQAGPTAMQAMFAKSLDLTYAGPSSIINAYALSRGDDIRIVAAR